MINMDFTALTNVPITLIYIFYRKGWIGSDVL